MRESDGGREECGSRRKRSFFPSSLGSVRVERRSLVGASKGVILLFGHFVFNNYEHWRRFVLKALFRDTAVRNNPFKYNKLSYLVQSMVYMFCFVCFGLTVYSIIRFPIYPI